MITEVQIGKTFIPEALKKVTIEGKTYEQFGANLTPMANLCELFKNSPTLWSEIQKNPEYIEEAQNEFRAFSHQVETQVRDKSLLKKLKQLFPVQLLNCLETLTRKNQCPELVKHQ